MVRGMNEGADSARGLRDRVVNRSEAIWEEAAQRVGDAASALSGTAERKSEKRSEAPSA